MRRKVPLMIATILLLQIILPMVSILFESGLTLISNAEGEENTEYYINTAQDLWDFAADVNNGNKFKDVTVYLMADIDLGCSEDNQWIPIGKGEGDLINTPQYYFSGTFEGNNHYIKGIYIDSASDTVGLFGVVYRERK